MQKQDKRTGKKQRDLNRRIRHEGRSMVIQKPANYEARIRELQRLVAAELPTDTR